MKILSPSLPLTIINIASIIAVSTTEWSFYDVIWLYWCQSVVIGVITFLKLKPTQPQKISRTNLPNHVFFMLHYGLFHFVYAIFLVSFAFMFDQQIENYFILIALILGFMASHIIEGKFNKASNKRVIPFMSITGLLPYIRVCTMHILIITAGFFYFSNNSEQMLIFFMVLKTVADIATQWLENKYSKKTVEKRTNI